MHELDPAATELVAELQFPQARESTGGFSAQALIGIACTCLDGQKTVRVIQKIVAQQGTEGEAVTQVPDSPPLHRDTSFCGIANRIRSWRAPVSWS